MIVALQPAVAASKPEFGRVGDQWDNEGWFVEVDFEVADNPVKPKDIIDDLRPHLAAKYAPLQPNGNGNQGVYLAEVSEDFVAVILQNMGLSIDDVSAANITRNASENADLKAQEALQGRTDIGPTQKQQLISARRGQGIFKANVRLNEDRCRVTGVTDPRFLIASHIKPWRDCSDHEKLDGCNGLLLSPHVDRLFDQGVVSFEDDGTILKSKRLSDEVWEAWGLSGIDNVGAFKGPQIEYLAHHRSKVFKS